MITDIIYIILFLVTAICLAIPLGTYISKVMDGEKVFLSKAVRPLEKGCYKLIGVNPEQEMSGRTYFKNVIIVSTVGFAAFFALLLTCGVKLDLAFNITSSFITNTNWQAYSGEVTLPNYVQVLGPTVQNFISAAVGISVLFGLIRGLAGKKGGRKLGNFYADITRVILYILLPLSIFFAIIFVSQGVVETFSSGVAAHMVEGGNEWIPLGPAASQEAIKQLGTNGGGFFGANSAFPFENPNNITNFMEMLAIILIPFALCFSFGRSVKEKKQGRALFLTMFILLVAALVGVFISEYSYMIPGISTALGNMEGKEVRFGSGLSALWQTLTTAASNGSTNAGLDSFTPFGGMICMVLIELGEVVFGGVGSGLFGMLGFVILTVFIAGLMVGRTPEYLHKKIDPLDMKMAVVLCLTTPVLILAGSTVACLLPHTKELLGNSGVHGFTEVLYAYSSAAGNNGSSFNGLLLNDTFLNISLGIIMLLARFVPIYAVFKLAENMREKKYVAESSATLRTDNAMFIGLLIFVVLLIGALSLFPALALGPIAEAL